MILFLDHEELSLLTRRVNLPGELRYKVSQAEPDGDLLLLELSDEDFLELTRHTSLALQPLARARNRFPLEDLLAAFAAQNEVQRPASPYRYNGLSVRQVGLLYRGDWSRDTPGLQLNGELYNREVVDTPIIRNAVILLLALGDEGTRATSAGNLNRKFVAEILASEMVPDEYAEKLRRHKKLLNESDVDVLHILRVQLEIAGVIKLEGNRFAPTELGRTVLETGGLAGLYLALFTAVFRRFNLGYDDPLPYLPEFQHHIGYSFHYLDQQGPGWHAYREVCPKLMMPDVAQKVPAHPYFNKVHTILELRLFRPLESFGLLDSDSAECGTPEGRSTEMVFRLTNLWRRFIGFDLEQERVVARSHPTA